MKNETYIRRTFVSQLNAKDCGIACMRMILNYAGLETASNLFSSLSFLEQQERSLLELKKIAATARLNAKCVLLDIPFLREIKHPCILHITNETGQHHFQVCYGAQKRRDGYYYLMADPARQVYLLHEKKLEQQWESRAALHFERLPLAQSYQPESSWHIFLSLNLFPGPFWLALPLIHVCSAILGVALSWVLEKGINGSFANSSWRLIVSILLLLLMITLFRCLLSFFRQKILITLSTAVHERLFSTLTRKLIFELEWTAALNEKSLQFSRRQMQKILQALWLFLSVLLADGSLIVLLLAGIFYLTPIAGLVNCLYLSWMTFISVKRLPRLLFENANLNEIAGATEKMIINTLRSSMRPADENISNFFLQSHRRYLEVAAAFSFNLSKKNLIFDCLGAFNVIVILSVCLFRVQHLLMSYNNLLVVAFLSFVMTALMPKLSNALFSIEEGATCLRQFIKSVGEPSKSK
jgi:ABC-type bacteriocin/lantibiotic exporter with double-glycine peptidase domain